MERSPTSLINEIPRMLELPSSVEILGVEQSIWRRWLTWTTWTAFLSSNVSGARHKSWRGHQPARRQWMVLGVKTIRTSLLVVKVVTLGWLCPEPLTHPRTWAVAMLLTVAVADMVRDHEDEHDLRRRPGGEKQQASRLLSRRGWRSLYVTVGLTALHFGVIGLASSSPWSHAFVAPWLRSACCTALGTP